MINSVEELYHLLQKLVDQAYYMNSVHLSTTNVNIKYCIYNPSYVSPRLLVIVIFLSITDELSNADDIFYGNETYIYR